MNAIDTSSWRRRCLRALVRVHHYMPLPGLILLLAPIYFGLQTSSYHWIWLVGGSVLIMTAISIELLIDVGRLQSESDDARLVVSLDDEPASTDSATSDAGLCDD
uniref:hypothetical protein n=1 Tax=Burkholderia arboris TaxID=488730 RepID=UPI003BEF2D78